MGVTIVLNHPYDGSYSNVTLNTVPKGLTGANRGYKNLKWMGYNMVKFVNQEKRVKWLIDLESRFSRLTK